MLNKISLTSKWFPVGWVWTMFEFGSVLPEPPVCDPSPSGLYLLWAADLNPDPPGPGIHLTWLWHRTFSTLLMTQTHSIWVWMDFLLYRNEHKLWTNRLDSVRSHITFRPRSSTFLTQLATKWERDRKPAKTHIVKQNTSERGPRKLVVNRTNRKDDHKNQITKINYDQNSVHIFKKIKTNWKTHQIKSK